MEKISFIKAKNLSYRYPEASKKSLDNINLEIEEGEFVLIVGGSGSGKSSLVRALARLIPEFYGGEFSGELFLEGKNINDFSKNELPEKVGMIFQDPESQLIMFNVEKELAFGMENINLPDYLMKRRIMEVSGALNLSSFLDKNIPDLSGGLKQKVALASILAMQPDVLILDEPTSQLDPVAGEEILTTVRRLNEDNGMTVILIEQRLERCFHLADRFLVLEDGQIILNTKSLGDVAKWAVEHNSPFIPPLSKFFALGDFPSVPITVKDGRKLLKDKYKFKNKKFIDKIDEGKKHKEKVLEVKNLWFTYPDGKEVLKAINFSAHRGQFISIMGENSAGKTTLLKNINGLLKASRGKVEAFSQDVKKIGVEKLAKKIGYLSQNPSDYLFLDSVFEEMKFSLDNFLIEDRGQVDAILKELDIYRYKDKNPRDLSSGERQRVALATVLVSEPEILLLDEPTRGLDYELKEKLGKILVRLKNEGKTIIMITHDVEFAAEYSEDILLMSQGRVISFGDKYRTLTRSTFYSPQISKLFNKINDQILTTEDGLNYLNSLEVQK